MPNEISVHLRLKSMLNLIVKLSRPAAARRVVLVLRLRQLGNFNWRTEMFEEEIFMIRHAA